MERLEITTLALVICVTCLVFLFMWKKNHKGLGKLPPGPTPLPIIGNLMQLNLKDIPASLSKLAKQYGPVYTLYLGSQTTVVLHGYEAVKEALIDQGDEFLGRGPIPIIDDTQRGYGLFFSNGDTWKQMRRFSLMTLRDFGMGKRSLEERIQEEAQFLVEELRKSEAQPFNPAVILSCATCNVICSILFNERFHYKDKTFQSLLDLLNKNFNRVSSPWNQIYNLWPKLIKPLPGEHRAFSKRLKDVNYFVLGKVKEHQKSLNHNNPRDYIDCFLIRMEQEKQNPESEFHLENLATCGSNLFSAGVETTTATLSYAFLLLMKYPEVQAKVHEEIDRVIGRARSPCLKDKMNLPYTEAVLHEIQRYITLIPSNLPHTVVRDTKFRQYVIPKGTTVLPLLSSVLYDCKEFPNPEKFDPGHFLDKNGSFRKTKYFVAFSIGKRACVGEGLARMELFLFFTTILQNFVLKPLGETKDIETKPIVIGVINMPPPFKLCLIPR
ncbi:cytochrome P450 2C23-like [Moschus berezovskii]|uniref:Cytochrome P450 2C23-like n=1 Tax=Moschus moschiferus TaxID=68415 RepID=A0A8C6EDW8_MOSMO|nr:cytochrome P450 2C23-like [Moschus berezovskii]